MNRYPRPVPTIGDTSRAVERRGDPAGWARPDAEIEALDAIIEARRDIRRFRPDPLPGDLVTDLLRAAHRGPSVGHSQPWRFVVVRDPNTQAAAAELADRHRLRQARELEQDAARQLLGLRLEGLREAPVGIVVACDRRTPATGVLGRATMHDADMWSCASAIQNLWLAARARGVGVGWVTLFEPQELAALVNLPARVEPLGWLCLGYPDERPPEPGLARSGWSRRMDLSDVIIDERWPDEPTQAPSAPPSRLASSPSRLVPPRRDDVVAVRDSTDELLAPPGALGLLDQQLDRLQRHPLAARASSATLLFVAGDHPVADLGVSAYDRSVTGDVLAAARAGESVGIRTAVAAGLAIEVVDAGSSTGNLQDTDALSRQRVADLIDVGHQTGRRLARAGLVVLGEVGIGNTTVAAALTAALIDKPADDVVGLGAGSDITIVDRKTEIVRSALARVGRGEPERLLAALGGPEFAVLAGAVIGTAEAGGAVVLDGLATTVAAALADAMRPGTVDHLVAGQVSNERAHALLLHQLGLEPLLALRLRAGEGVGASIAARVLLDGLHVRQTTARTR